MQPGLDRATFLPMAGNRSQKNLQFAAPGIVYDAAKALATPYAALKGVNVTPEDAFNVAGNVMGGGLSASALLPVERGVIGANVYKNRKGSDLAEALVKRSKEKVGTTGQYVGAPSGIDSRKKYNAVVNNYLDAIKEGQKKCYEENKEHYLEYQKVYQKENKEQIAERSKTYRESHKEQISNTGKVRYEAKKEELKAKSKAYYEANKDEINKKKREARALKKQQV